MVEDWTIFLETEQFLIKIKLTRHLICDGLLMCLELLLREITHNLWKT